MSQTPYPPSPAPKLLRRSRGDRLVGGVCGGVATYLNMDPTLVRILTVVLTLFTGVPVVLYVVTLVLMPEEDAAPPPSVAPAPGDPVWGAGGPPWAQATDPVPSSSEPVDPPRREGGTA